MDCFTEVIYHSPPPPPPAPVSIYLLLFHRFMTGYLVIFILQVGISFTHSFNLLYISLCIPLPLVISVAVSYKLGRSDPPLVIIICRCSLKTGTIGPTTGYLQTGTIGPTTGYLQSGTTRPTTGYLLTKWDGLTYHWLYRPLYLTNWDDQTYHCLLTKWDGLTYHWLYRPLYLTNWDDQTYHCLLTKWDGRTYYCLSAAVSCKLGRSALHDISYVT